MCVPVAGHCFWEKTSNGCKSDDDTFRHNAYDFYALCHKGEKDAEFQYKEEPAKLSAGKCADRDEKETGLVERISGKSNNMSPKKKLCFDCQRSTCTY